MNLFRDTLYLFCNQNVTLVFVLMLFQTFNYTFNLTVNKIHAFINNILDCMLYKVSPLAENFAITISEKGLVQFKKAFILFIKINYHCAFNSFTATQCMYLTPMLFRVLNESTINPLHRRSKVTILKCKKSAIKTEIGEERNRIAQKIKGFVDESYFSTYFKVFTINPRRITVFQNYSRVFELLCVCSEKYIKEIHFLGATKGELSITF